jgi:hypothetical protein
MVHQLPLYLLYSKIPTLAASLYTLWKHSRDLTHRRNNLKFPSNENEIDDLLKENEFSLKEINENEGSLNYTLFFLFYSSISYYFTVFSWWARFCLRRWCVIGMYYDIVNRIYVDNAIHNLALGIHFLRGQFRFIDKKL